MESGFGTGISIVIGGLISVLTVVGVEYLRRPKLTLAIEKPPRDAESPGGKSMRRNLRLKLRNEPLPAIARWMQRAAAIQCRGEITFHHLDCQNVFGRAMPVRWARSTEPTDSPILNSEGQVVFRLREFERLSLESRIDVYPDDEELLDVAV